MLLAVHCAACDRPGPSPCPSCRALLRPPAPEPDPPGLPGLVAVLRYDGPARALVARVKYRNQRQALAWLADALAEAVAVRLAEGRPAPRGPTGVGGRRSRRAPGPADLVVTWAPTTDAHRRARGFDHGELLARAVARRLGVPCRRLLRRAAGAPQTGRAAHARRTSGPAFVPRGSLHPHAVVVVVDDVVTTGATLRSAAAALRGAGAARVLPAALARTPSRRDPADAPDARRSGRL